MNRRYLLLVFLVVLSVSVAAQNLVLNGSFEDKSYCPTNFNQQLLKVIEHWSQVNEGTPDYFNACSSKVGVPANVFGTQSAHSGEAYAGMATYSPGQRNYREYLTTRLTRPLKPGELVCVEMYVSAADFCKYVTDGLGIVLSKDKLKQERAFVIDVAAGMENPKLHMLDESEGWILLSDLYTAKGGEEYLTIGNFKPDTKLKILKRTKEQGAQANSKWAYHYIDDVAVKPVKSRSECSCENEFLASLVVDPPLELSEYDNIRLDDVLFDFDQDAITSQASKQLDEIFILMKKNKSMYMAIDGHTDAIGNDVYNLSLSQRRADQVIHYLTERGISEERFTKTALGSSKPAASNDTEEGRAQNRRVEFHIRQKRFELIQ